MVNEVVAVVQKWIPYRTLRLYRKITFPYVPPIRTGCSLENFTMNFLGMYAFQEEDIRNESIAISGWKSNYASRFSSLGSFQANAYFSTSNVKFSNEHPVYIYICMYIFYLGIHISVRTLSIVSTGANRPFTRNGSHFQRKTLRFGFAM